MMPSSSQNITTKSLCNTKLTKMNYSQVFAKYNNQGWDESTKLKLILEFLDLNAQRIVTPRLFNQFLQEIQIQEIQNEENSY